MRFLLIWSRFRRACPARCGRVPGRGVGEDRPIRGQIVRGRDAGKSGYAGRLLELLRPEPDWEVLDKTCAQVARLASGKAVVPRLAHMIIGAADRGLGPVACALAALLDLAID